MGRIKTFGVQSSSCQERAKWEIEGEGPRRQVRRSPCTSVSERRDHTWPHRSPDPDTERPEGRRHKTQGSPSTLFDTTRDGRTGIRWNGGPGVLYDVHGTIKRFREYFNRGSTTKRDVLRDGVLVPRSLSRPWGPVRRVRRRRGSSNRCCTSVVLEVTGSVGSSRSYKGGRWHFGSVHRRGGVSGGVTKQEQNTTNGTKEVVSSKNHEKKKGKGFSIRLKLNPNMIYNK